MAKAIVALVVAWVLMAFSGQAAAEPPANDDFSNRTIISGYILPTDALLSAATAEPGEPPHFFGTGFNSVWWQWQAPVRGVLTLTNLSPASNVVLSLFRGPSLESLSLLATGTGSITATIVGGDVYQFAAAMPSAEAQDVQLRFSLAPRTVSSPVPGNLLCEPSFEGTGFQFTCWKATNFGGSANEFGGGDGAGRTTWVRLSARPLLFPGGITAAFINRLTNHNDAVSSFIWSQILPADQAYLQSSAPFFAKVGRTSSTLNNIVTNGPLYNSDLFAGVSLSEETQMMLATNPTGMTLWRLNRLLIEDAFPEITRALCGTIEQEFETVPGRTYEVCLAVGISAGAKLRAMWNNTLLPFPELTATDTAGWHWRSVTVAATGALSQVTFQNVGEDIFSTVSVDGVSVIWLNEPPAITSEPSSVSTVAGGTAAFAVGASGLPPLPCQWYFNSLPLPGKTSLLLQINNVSSNHIGEYFLVITNEFGSVTSRTVSLLVETPVAPTIVLQPYGDRVTAGSYHVLGVAALGYAPLSYQWFYNGAALTDATNRHLVFVPIDLTNAGLYSVSISNSAGFTWSLPANLVVEVSTNGGGGIRFENRGLAGISTNTTPIFDIDGTTKLVGAAYLAQLYAGDSLATLRPVGVPSVFGSSFNAGTFQGQNIIFPTIAPGQHVFLQVRAWQASSGATYEEARALGGKFGRSPVFEGTALPLHHIFPGQGMPGLQSFNLLSGLPQFNVGRIEYAGRDTNGALLWNLVGEMNSRYVIERSITNLTWQPFLVLTNLSGNTMFTDSSEGSQNLYRSRILD